MKYLKPYKIFESVYSYEEYIGAISDELSKYNISPVKIRELIENYSSVISDAISNGVTPYDFIKSISVDMGLSDDGGFLSHRFPNSQQSTIKYL